MFETLVKEFFAVAQPEAEKHLSEDDQCAQRFGWIRHTKHKDEDQVETSPSSP